MYVLLFFLNQWGSMKPWGGGRGGGRGERHQRGGGQPLSGASRQIEHCLLVLLFYIEECGSLECDVKERGSIECGFIECGSIDLDSVECGFIECGSIECSSVECGFIECGSLRM